MEGLFHPEGLKPLTLQDPDSSCSESCKTSSAGKYEPSVKSVDSTGAAMAPSNKFLNGLLVSGIILDSENVPAPPSLAALEAALRQVKPPEPTTEAKERKIARIVQKTCNAEDIRQVLFSILVPIDDIWESNDFATTSSQLWSKMTALCENISAKIASTRPDQTIGFSPDCFPCYESLRHLDTYAQPVPSSSLVFPVFTAEWRGVRPRL